MTGAALPPIGGAGLPPLAPGRFGHDFIANAANALSVDSRHGVRTNYNGSRRSGSLSARGPGPGAQEGIISGHAFAGLRNEQHVQPGSSLGLCPREEREMRSLCEHIGAKAGQKFKSAREAFRFMDADRDGRITQSEMRYFFRAYDLKNDTADWFFERLDHDATGEVAYDDFVHLMAPYIHMGGECNKGRPFITPGTFSHDTSQSSTREPTPAETTRCDRDEPGRLTPTVERDFQGLLDLVRDKVRQRFANPRECFRFVDGDQDGSISRGEMRYFFRAFNVPAEQSDSFFDCLDEGGNGEVEFNTFVKFVGPTVWPNEDVARPASRAPQVPSSARGSSRRSQLSSCGSAEGSSRDAWPDDREQQSNSTPMRGEVYQARVAAMQQQSALQKELKQVMQDIGQKVELKFRHVRDAFRSLDLDKDGSISLMEMRSFLRGFGWSEDVADRIFHLMDTNGCGEIDYHEFMMHFDSVLGPANRPPKRSPKIAMGDRALEKDINQVARMLGEKLATKYKDVRSAFRAFDRDKDGTVTKTEVRDFFKTMCMPKEAADKVFMALDKDGSGQVEYDEFMSLFGPIIQPGEQRSVADIRSVKRPLLWRLG